MPNTDYIDFNCIQSSHGFKGFSSEKMVSKTLKLEKKPCLDAECAYEDIPLELDTEWGFYFSGRDIRRRIYKNMLLGAFGHTYGHADVWCFNTEKSEHRYTWREALFRPMAQQVCHINELLGMVDITQLNTQNLCKNAVCAQSCDSIMVYLETAYPVFMELKKDLGERTLVYFNTKTGERITRKQSVNKKTVISNPFSNDAVLIIK